MNQTGRGELEGEAYRKSLETLVTARTEQLRQALIQELRPAGFSEANSVNAIVRRHTSSSPSRDCETREPKTDLTAVRRQTGRTCARGGPGGLESSVAITARC